MEEPTIGKEKEFKGNGDTIEPASSLPGYRPDTDTDAINASPVKTKQSLATRIKHSFRRREDTIHLNALGQQVIDGDKVVPPGESGHDTSRLDRRLKGRHMQMIAIGGAIGTGLFIGSGSALATGGPAALMIGFGIVGVMLFCVIHALGELAVMFPIAGNPPPNPVLLSY
jgi:amino acid permease